MKSIKNTKTIKDQPPLCACGCGQPVTKCQNKYIRGHNARKLKGRTKDTHDYIRRIAEKNKGKQPWNKGLTKETSKIIRMGALKYTGRNNYRWSGGWKVKFKKLTKNKEEGKDYLLCKVMFKDNGEIKICNHYGKSLSHHLKNAHGLTKNEYTELYSDKIICDSLHKNISIRAKNTLKKHPNLTSENGKKTVKILREKYGKEFFSERGKKGSKGLWSKPKCELEKMIRKGCITRGQTPNNTEKYIINFLNLNYPGEFIYTGHGRFLLIANKRPDFTHIYLPFVIEYLGDLYHTKEEVEKRIKLFRSEGIETVIIWGSEFCKENGKEILKQRINYTKKLLHIGEIKT